MYMKHAHGAMRRNSHAIEKKSTGVKRQKSMHPQVTHFASEKMRYDTMRTIFGSTCVAVVQKPCSLRFCGEFNAAGTLCIRMYIHHQGQGSHHFKANTKVSTSIIFRSIGHTLTCLPWNYIALVCRVLPISTSNPIVAHFVVATSVAAKQARQANLLTPEDVQELGQPKKKAPGPGPNLRVVRIGPKAALMRRLASAKPKPAELMIKIMVHTAPKY